MRILIGVSFILLGYFAKAQKPLEELIIGDWKQATSKNDSMLLHFDSDRSMFIINKDQNLGIGSIKLQNGDSAKMLMRYKISKTDNYTNIDFIYALDNYFNTVGKSEGIIEILNPDLLKLAMNHDKPVPQRPTSFQNAMETQILKRVNSNYKNCDCERFHTGKFILNDLHNGPTMITRDENIQIEEVEDGSYKVKLKVNWIDECTYTLELIEYLAGEDWIPNSDKLVLTVYIIYSDENSYIQTTTVSNSEFIRTMEIEKIE